MLEIKSRWNDVTDKQKWATRRTSLVAKLSATKAVWFPPKPEATAKKAGSTAKKATKRATTKTTTGAKKKATAAKKTATGTKKVTQPVGRKKA
jgi:hypothetical protein